MVVGSVSSIFCSQAGVFVVSPQVFDQYLVALLNEALGYFLGLFCLIEVLINLIASWRFLSSR